MKKKVFLIFLVFFGLIIKINAVDNAEKNFCNTGQKYHFDCHSVEMQCNYKNGNDTYYINIKKNGADMTVSKNDDSHIGIANYGKSADGYPDFKSNYEKTGKCPAYLISSNGKYYVTSTNDSSNQSSNDYFKLSLTFYTTNSLVTNSVDDGVEENQHAPDVSNCAGFHNESSCNLGETRFNGNFGCAWNKKYSFCSPTGLAYLSCGKGDTNAYDIPVIVPRLTSYAIILLKTITPVILIFIGMFQLIKAIVAQNEDEMKKARGSLVKKLIAATMIFFIVSIVQFAIKQVADDSEQSSAEACLDCFINNNCKNALYYTDYINGYGICYSVLNPKQKISCPTSKY